MNKTAKIVVSLAVIVVVILVGYNMATKRQGGKAQNMNGPIKIGVSGPLTGDIASWGINQLAGATLAVNEINANGGVKGRKIELVPEDDKCESTLGVSVFNKLINVDKVDAIIGPICSSIGGPALPVAQNYKVPTVITTATAPSLTVGKDYIYRISPSDAMQGKVAIDLIFNKMNKKKVAVIYVKNDWGQAIKDIFIKGFIEKGGEIVLEDSVAQDSSDLRTQLTKVKNSGAELLYFPVYPVNAIAGMKQMKDMGINLPVVAGDGVNGEEVIKSGVAEGLIYTVAKINTPDEFKIKIHNLPGYENLDIAMPAPLGYDAIKILSQAMENVGTNKEKVKNKLVEMYYDKAVSNPIIEFDENGDLKQGEFEIMIIKNKQSVKFE